ncbi:S8 family peptidase [Ruania alba]|uniref:Subtilase family protein n=1 Tax=Ruania alba TaxID=648782 RepID=A0A1H5N6G1_9MICO|nr:S8/S53 family peptidase [Ruania alba]SEE97134.1 Subtilase family protein [Ruania alba]
MSASAPMRHRGRWVVAGLVAVAVVLGGYAVVQVGFSDPDADPDALAAPESVQDYQAPDAVAVSWAVTPGADSYLVTIADQPAMTVPSEACSDEFCYLGLGVRMFAPDWYGQTISATVQAQQGDLRSGPSQPVDLTIPEPGTDDGPISSLTGGALDPLYVDDGSDVPRLAPEWVATVLELNALRDRYPQITGEGVSVAVIEFDAIEPDHPHLPRGLAPSIPIGPDGPITDMDPATLADHHANQVAGIIVGTGRIPGLAPGVTLTTYATKSTTSPDNVAAAIEHAVAAGADVVNVSLSVQPDWIEAETRNRLQAAVSHARDVGVLVVAGSGNWGGTPNQNSPQWCGFGHYERHQSPLPAFFQHSYSVGASTPAGTRWHCSVDPYLADPSVHPGFPNPVSALAPAAPFPTLPSTQLLAAYEAMLAGAQLPPSTIQAHLQDSYFFDSGTSGAAPIVTSVAALVMQADPTLSIDGVEEILDQAQDAEGVIQPVRAVELALGTEPDGSPRNTPVPLPTPNLAEPCGGAVPEGAYPTPEEAIGACLSIAYPDEDLEDVYSGACEPNAPTTGMFCSTAVAVDGERRNYSVLDGDFGGNYLMEHRPEGWVIIDGAVCDLSGCDIPEYWP